MRSKTSQKTRSKKKYIFSNDPSDTKEFSFSQTETITPQDPQDPKENIFKFIKVDFGSPIKKKQQSPLKQKKDHMPSSKIKSIMRNFEDDIIDEVIENPTPMFNNRVSLTDRMKVDIPGKNSVDNHISRSSSFNERNIEQMNLNKGNETPTIGGLEHQKTNRGSFNETIPSNDENREEVSQNLSQIVNQNTISSIY